MSIIWQQTAGADHYEVRKAGRSVRLYRNGVLHTQYNPNQPVGDNLWDLLMLPAFFRAPGSIRRVLVLGVGGGAVIRLLNQFVRPTSITGIELSPLHIEIAQRFFGIDRQQARLVRADAGKWVARYRGRPFDLIIDDVFGETDGIPMRAIDADSSWFRRLRTLLAPGGILVMNFAERAELERSGWYRNASVRRRFAAAFRLHKPQYENIIATFPDQPVTSRQLRGNLACQPDLNPRVKSNRVDYRIRRLRSG